MIPNVEIPLVVNSESRGISNRHIFGHLSIVQNAPKINGLILKLKVREDHLPHKVDVVYVGVLFVRDGQLRGVGPADPVLFFVGWIKLYSHLKHKMKVKIRPLYVLSQTCKPLFDNKAAVF